MHLLRKLLLFCCLSTALHAQEQLGLRQDNFAGINAAFSNPAISAHSPLAWDINLTSIGYFFDNNLGYIDKANIFKLAKNYMHLGPHPDLGLKIPKETVLFGNLYNRPDLKYASSILTITGPSALVNFKRGHSVGLFTNLKAAMTARRLPLIFNYFDVVQIPTRQSVSIPRFSGATMAWSEIGLSYAYKLDEDLEGGLSIGANVKYLNGYLGAFAENNWGTRITRLSEDSVRVDASRYTFGFTDNYQTNPLSSNGRGFAFDIGAVMVVNDGDDNVPYRWRFGVSILDIGWINLKKNVQIHELQTSEEKVFTTSDFRNIDMSDPVDDALGRISQKFYNNARGSLKEGVIAVGMPAGLNIQADLAVMPYLFVNTQFMKRINLNGINITRDEFVSVMPRFESRWFSASLPLVMLNWQKLRVGAAVRLGYLTVGTDHFGSWFGKGKLDGTDVYMALKVNPFEVGRLEKKKRQRSAKCYRFR